VCPIRTNPWGFVWATLAVGAANVPLPKVSGDEVLDRSARHGVSLLCAAPTVLRMIIAAAAARPGAPPAGVRVGTAGGAPSADLIEAVEDRLGWPVVHMYGLTETTAFLTYCEEPADLADRPLLERARFKARQGVPLLLSGRIDVRGGDGRPIAADGQEMGEVVARGNVVMAGYHRDPEATALAMPDGWFRTGDLAVRHPDGYIELRDRLKDVIKTGGEQVPSLEVEHVLTAHPDVADAVVVAGPHPLWVETPVAFVVMAGPARLDAVALTAWCRAHLTHFKVPTRFVAVTDLPRTASGKVRKAELRRRLVDEAGGSAPQGGPGYVPPDARPSHCHSTSP